MNVNKPKLTLYKPATYQIKVPIVLDETWADWLEMKIVKAEYDNGMFITSLTSKVDQAGLLGLLRRLYSLGLTLISVICVDTI